MNYSYFDETYFERGEERGTAYCNYLAQARHNPVYAEIAQVCAALGATRALEIGCATGVVVEKLNALGVEAHGVDVSEWAVSHRAHPNVTLAAAERLPFEDATSIASIPFTASSRPRQRGPSRIRRDGEGQLSPRLPLPHPADPRFGALRGRSRVGCPGLRKDPTHHLLEDLPTWL
jgi:hypothetical protein